jgi:alpha-glucoside transport system permease protein
VDHSGTMARPSTTTASPAVRIRGSLRKYAAGLLFLLPTFVLLGAWIVYPTVYTVVRSFYGQSGFGDFVGLGNYRTLFTTSTLVTAIKNSAIWVAVVPAFVTAIGLIFAVLTERIRWSVAFTTALFLPMAISAFATGVTWRIMYQQDPDLGAINALGRVVVDAVSPPGVLPDAIPSTTALSGSPANGLVLRTPLHAGSIAPLGLTAISPEAVPKGAKQAVGPHARRGEVVGVVWRDFKPGGGRPGVVDPGELGLPGVSVELRDAAGKVVRTATTGDDGAFAFADVGTGTFHTAISKQTFAQPWGGVGWLGTKLITPSLLIAYIWIWAGFAMVVIAAGLSALPREVLEAARVDGANEWQVFRRVTVPLLAPVLSVVFLTMLINVLKVFDLVITLAPGSSQDAANVIALALWRESFGGVDDFGVGSAIAVFLFLLVIPVLALNIRRFRRET